MVRILLVMAIAVGLPTTLTNEAFSGATGLWLLNEGEGAVATDSSGNGNDCQLTGTIEWSDGVKIDGYLGGNGTTDYCVQSRPGGSQNSTGSESSAAKEKGTAKMNTSNGQEPARILFRDRLPEGLSLETNVLSGPQHVLVHYRPSGWSRPDLWVGRNRDNVLADWSLAITEMIGTSKGFIFSFRSPEGWERVPGETNAIQYESQSEPRTKLRSEFQFAGPDDLIDWDSLVHYRAGVSVKENVLEIELAITNLSDEPTSLFTHLCNRFHGRGLFWGWRGRTYLKVGEEWVLADKLLLGKGYPAGTHWFLESNLPGPRFMEMYRSGSSTNSQARILTSPFIVMQMEDMLHTAIYGSPQAGMIFVNPTNPCLHSDALTQNVPPKGTAVQKTFLAVYKLPLHAAIAEFEKQMKTQGY